MTDDWTREIKERLEKAEKESHLSSQFNDERDLKEFHLNAPTDIANLLKEREVLREALKFYAKDCEHRISPNNSIVHVSGPAKEALAYDPRKEKL